MEIKDIYSDLPTFETERLIIRRITLDAAKDLYNYASNKKVTKFVTWEAHESLEVTRGGLKNLL